MTANRHRVLAFAALLLPLVTVAIHNGVAAPRAPQTSSGPLNVLPALDPTTAVTSLIRAATGGVMTITGADGTVFLLTVPPNALLSDEMVTMTPMFTVGGLPVSGGLVAGVQLEPDGLRLFQPATLTIVPTVSVPLDQQQPFSYQGSGQNFAFFPLYGTDVTFKLIHFSGEGLAQGTQTQDFTPADSETVLQNQLAILVNSQRAISSGDSASDLQAALLDNFNNQVAPQLDRALTDDSVAVKAMNDGTSWARQVELSGLGSTPPFDADERSVFEKFVPISTNYFNKAWGRCQNDTAAKDRFTELQKMLLTVRNLSLFGHDYLSLLPDANREMSACSLGKLKLDFDSQMNGLVNRVTESARVQANNAMLTLNTTTWQYTAATVPLNEVSVSYSSPDPGDCSILNTGSGTTDIQADIDLNLGPGDPLKSADVRVTMNPQVQEIFTPGGVVEGSCQLGMPSASAVAYYPFWLVTHLAGTGFAPYNTLLNTPKAIGSSGSQGGISATETGNITVSQVDP